LLVEIRIAIQGWKVVLSANTTTPILRLIPLTIIPEISSAQPAFPNTTFPFPQH
jgi:hypothetical protein